MQQTVPYDWTAGDFYSVGKKVKVGSYAIVLDTHLSHNSSFFDRRIFFKVSKYQNFPICFHDWKECFKNNLSPYFKFFGES